MKKDSNKKYHYTYYSYEEWGMGYFGSRSCDCLPEEDINYFGSFKDKNFKPTQKTILKDDYETRVDAIEDEIILHNFYQVDKNPHFANKARQKTTGFYYSAKGVVRTEEYKQKMSERLKGREIKPEWIAKGVENRRTYEGENNPFYGKEHSQETKDHLKQKTIETWKNQPHPWIGRKHSEESKVKFREKNAGENNPNYGKTQSAETKEKSRLAKLGRKLWNNGEQQKFSKECPGEGWILGGLKNKKEA
jgi:hypothetical protein